MDLTTLSDLPVDIIVFIAQTFLNLKEIGQLRQVCKATHFPLSVSFIEKALHKEKHKVRIVKHLKRKMYGLIHEGVETSNMLKIAYGILKGEDINGGRLSPLHEAVRLQDVRIVDLLVRMGASLVSKRVYMRDTPVNLAANLNRLDVLKYFTANLSAKGEHGRTPLHQFCISGNLEGVQWLLEQKTVDHKILDSHKKTALFLAVQNGHMEIVSALLKARKWPDVIVSEAIDEAMKTEDPSFKESLIRMLVSAYPADADSLNFGYFFVWNKSDTIIELLRQGYLPANYAHTFVGNTRISHFAAEKGHTEILRLINGRCDLNVQDENGNTPLHLAVKGSHSDTVRFLLLDAECDGDKPNKSGLTPLDIAEEKYNQISFQLAIRRMKYNEESKRLEKIMRVMGKRGYGGKKDKSCIIS
eukprot:TRINITY_DN5363_c0_g1_i1.p1 TRINITY_DN5363_c0_g1~~TRINITY_DN5363_c0_g1_i1.p1  ORF type:complete len:415 (-),score=52.25 TRINITY_DN5363_c0_g1_i1:83-1327(-)